MIPFHQTGLGRRFYESQLPQLIDALVRIAVALERLERLRKSEEPHQ